MTAVGALALAALAFIAGALIGVLRRHRLAQEAAELIVQLATTEAALLRSETDLAAERALVARLSGGADDILAAVRAAQQQEEPADGR